MLTSKMSAGEYTFLKLTLGNTRVVILFTHRSQSISATVWETAIAVSGGCVAPRALTIH